MASHSWHCALHRALELQERRARETTPVLVAMLATGQEGLLGLVDACLHEAAKPLAAIMAYAELLEDEVSGKLGPDQRSQVETILRNVVRQERLFRRLRDLAEFETGTTSSRDARAVHRLAELCREANEGEVREPSHARVDEEASVLAERTRLVRTLRDLLELARSESERHTLSIARKGLTTVFELTLEGCAFPEEVERLFDPIERLEGRSVLARALGTGATLVGPTARSLGGEFTVTRNGAGGEERLYLELELPSGA